MSGSVTYASMATVLMPAAFASSSAGFRPSGSFGLKMIASTSLAIRSRMLLELAGRVRRSWWITVSSDDLARDERLGLGRAELLLAEAVADAAGVRVADRVLLGRRQTATRPRCSDAGRRRRRARRRAGCGRRGAAGSARGREGAIAPSANSRLRMDP